MRETWLVCEWESYGGDDDDIFGADDSLFEVPTVIAEFINRKEALSYISYLVRSGRRAFAMAPEHPMRRLVTGVDHFFEDAHE